MAKDVFGRRPLEFGGAFAADSASINLDLGPDFDTETSGLIVQQLSISYQQPITRLYEVGSQKTYYVAGRPQGNANLARVLGPGVLSAAFYERLGNVCNANCNDLCFCFQANCETDCQQTPNFNPLQIGLKNVIMQSIGFSVAAMDMIINEQLSLFFTAMIVDDQHDCQQAQDLFVDPSCFA